MPTTATFFIVTPSYNQSHFIEKTITSVRNQEGNFKIIHWVVDGGSTDETVRFLRVYEGSIKWLSEKDKGQTDAINKGIHKLQSIKTNRPVYFAYLNSDDYYLPGTFEAVHQEFEQRPHQNWLVGDAVIIDEHGHEIQQPVRHYKKLFRRPFLRSLLPVLNYIPQPSTFIRWPAVQDTGLFDENLRYVMDYDYWLRLRKKFGYPIFTSKALSAFRIHGQSKGGSQYNQQFDEELQIAKKYVHNSLPIFLHRLHNGLIKAVYNRIK